MGIITDGLARYYHFEQGLNGNVWENIAPAYKSTSNATLIGAIILQDGVSTDGVDDYISIPILTFPTNNLTIECMFIPETQGTGNRVVFGETIYSVVYISGGNIYTYAPQDGSTGRTAGNQLITNIGYGNPVYITYRFDASGGMITVFINREKHELPTDSSLLNLPSLTWNDKALTFGRRGNSTIGSSHLKSKFSFVRIYDRALGDEEIAQNHALRTSVGLETETSKLPSVTKLVTDKPIISDEPGINQSIITVQFDTNVTEYVARLNGTSPDTGEIVHQGGAVAANTDAQILIDWNELTSEGANRINVYGKNASGDWTKYES